MRSTAMPRCCAGVNGLRNGDQADVQKSQHRGLGALNQSKDSGREEGSDAIRLVAEPVTRAVAATNSTSLHPCWPTAKPVPAHRVRHRRQEHAGNLIASLRSGLAGVDHRLVLSLNSDKKRRYEAWSSTTATGGHHALGRWDSSRRRLSREGDRTEDMTARMRNRQTRGRTARSWCRPATAPVQ